MKRSAVVSGAIVWAVLVSLLSSCGAPTSDSNQGAVAFRLGSNSPELVRIEFSAAYDQQVGFGGGSARCSLGPGVNSLTASALSDGVSAPLPQATASSTTSSTSTSSSSTTSSTTTPSSTTTTTIVGPTTTTTTAPTTTTTVPAACGNETVESGEQCDDGNTTDGDDCDHSCQLEGSTSRYLQVVDDAGSSILHITIVNLSGIRPNWTMVECRYTPKGDTVPATVINDTDIAVDTTGTLVKSGSQKDVSKVGVVHTEHEPTQTTTTTTTTTTTSKSTTTTTL